VKVRRRRRVWRRRRRDLRPLWPR